MLVNAIDGFSEPLEDLRAALDASGVVGTWDWDCVLHTARYDAGAAALLAGDAGLAGRTLRAEAAMAGVHPDDLGWMTVEIGRAIETGSVILSEYRVRAPGRGTRWVLSRGRVYRDPRGRPVRCKGILIDITESRQDTRDDSRGYLAQPAVFDADPLSRVADCCLEARRLAGPEDTASRLRTILDLALYEVGRRLAARTRD